MIVTRLQKGKGVQKLFCFTGMLLRESAGNFLV